MMYEVITKERLQDFYNSYQYFEKLLNDKKSIEARLQLKGVSYDGIKVMSGNGRKLSEQERFVIALERIDNEINRQRTKLEYEKSVIEAQLLRLPKPIHRKIIALKYIEKWKIWEIIEDLYIGDPRWNPDMDLEEFKKSSEYEYFRNQFYHEEKVAIKNLEKITGKPFVENQNQLRIFREV